jgi:two-component system, OmpR family, sensor histidine kinase KdpD
MTGPAPGEEWPPPVAELNSSNVERLRREVAVSGRGSLRTYLGTVPGVGKTYAMLSEGRRRADTGERVMVGWLEGKDRAATRGQLGDLAVVEPLEVVYRGSTFLDLDVEAVIGSGAEVVLIDELAHRRPDGLRRRHEDIAQVLASGASVITTTNVSNLRSVRDYVARITGVGAVECVPDDFVRSGEVVLVDLAPDALRRRIASGAVFSLDQVGGALADYFRVSNLEALAELAQAWLAGREQAVGDDLLASRGLVGSVEPPIVIAGDSGSHWGEEVIRQSARLARGEDATLVVVHVNTDDGSPPLRARLEGHRRLTAELGGTYVEIDGDSSAVALADAARARGATRVVVAHHRSRLGELAHGSTSKRLRRLLPDTPVEEVRSRAAGAAEG